MLSGCFTPLSVRGVPPPFFQFNLSVFVDDISPLPVCEGCSGVFIVVILSRVLAVGRSWLCAERFLVYSFSLLIPPFDRSTYRGGADLVPGVRRPSLSSCPPPSQLPTGDQFKPGLERSFRGFWTIRAMAASRFLAPAWWRLDATPRSFLLFPGRFSSGAPALCSDSMRQAHRPPYSFSEDPPCPFFFLNPHPSLALPILAAATTPAAPPTHPNDLFPLL